MSVAGHIYGVALNDRQELDRISPEFDEKPYLAAPRAPVVYMKPRASLARSVVAHPAETLVCAPTLALLMARDATGRTPDNALDCVGAIAICLDISLPQSSYYRPAIAYKNADGFLALGDWAAPVFPEQLKTYRESQLVHQWGFDRLHRSPAMLLAELSGFMTLRAGDVLLVGLPGDAPVAAPGEELVVKAQGLPSLQLERTGRLP
ncbi:MULTISPECIES: fumarylacetoacetate hydrolase family protein [unclassified Sphingomonas]|uniref:fumarylacetoacetate hydrolase family protein n=1 Tax=Novosphingobium rhizosphaerae TaxID=1551649 RepID=UPI0015CB9920